MGIANYRVNEKVNVFNTIMKNMLFNFIPHETITCDNKRSTLDKQKYQTINPK